MAFAEEGEHNDANLTWSEVRTVVEEPAVPRPESAGQEARGPAGGKSGENDVAEDQRCPITSLLSQGGLRRYIEAEGLADEIELSEEEMAEAIRLEQSEQETEPTDQ
jgi:hypothetical protein